MKVLDGFFYAALRNFPDYLDVELFRTYHLIEIERKSRLIPAEVDMKTLKCLVGLLIISMIALCAGSASAWDPRWQFKQAAHSNNYGSSTRDIEMQKKFDYNSMNKFKGTTDKSNGYTVMRNLNGDSMRGYIDKDGSGLLQDQKGNFYRVNTRW
jgi:hypothetical protein